MKTTLPFADRLLALGQNYLQQGRDQEALRVLGHLSRLPEAPREVAEEAQAGMAGIYFRRNKFAQARRHLHIALARDPQCARYYHLLGVTLEDDDVLGAVKHYRRAVELAPQVAEYHADLGLCLMSLAETKTGLKHLRKAVELAPDDPEFVRHLALQLIEANQAAEAKQVVIAARFRNPREPRLKGLWQELCFQTAKQEQRRAAVATRLGLRANPILRFKPARRQRAPGREMLTDGTILRMDGPGPAAAPHLFKPVPKRQR